MIMTLILVLFAMFCGMVLPQAVTLQQGGNPERALLSYELAQEVGLMHYYEGMSIMDDGNGMGKGKGKGKGNDDKCKGHGNPKDCDKSSKKGKSKKKKEMGMGKGMEQGMGKGMKKGMSKDKEKSMFPSESIVPTLSIVPSQSPPSITISPSLANKTAAPVNIEDIIQLLSPYSIFYQIEQTRIPSISEYAELSAFTAAYLNDYFSSIYVDMATVFLTSITNISGSEFRLGQPVRVDYNTTTVFGLQSQIIPNLTELDATLASAFEGNNGEIFAAAVTAGLDPANIFSTTSSISFQEATIVSSDIEGARIAMISIISVMSVLVFVGFAIAIAHTFKNEKFEKVSLQTDDSSTDNESRNENKEIENDAPLPKSRRGVLPAASAVRYTNILQEDAGSMGFKSSDMREASSN